MLFAPSKTAVTEITGWFTQLQVQLRETHQRRLLCAQGDMAWCDDIARIIQSHEQNYLAISDRQLEYESTSYSKVETLLGREASLVIVDSFEGINPDVICIASGLLVQGGLLLMLSEKPENGLFSNDKFGVWQDGATNTGNFTNYYFSELMLYPEACIFLRQEDAKVLPSLIKCSSVQITASIGGKTQEQLDILNQLDGWLNSQAQTILLLTADRGRGKSTCLGFIVQALTSCSRLKVLVSAYSKSSAAVLLQQAGDVEFVAPDRLIKDKKEADVLIIDEAAMLPFPMLQQLLGSFKKVVMATTTGGYEGTGQGFLLRFLANLPAEKLLLLNINRPVRWSSQDYLEPCLNSVLLLNPTLEVVNQPVLSSDIIYRVIDIKDCTDISLLKKVYQLMASVHYRTRPSDLRMLMDNPDLSLVLAEVESSLVGVLVLNREGGFEADLCEQIYRGIRRPKGHLLAQMITAQSSVKSFGSYCGMRIQRIAVLPSMRRRGIGRQLIETANEYARNQQFDYIGACFAFDAEISLFWHHCQFTLVQVGFSQGKSTGNHSVAVLKHLTSDLDDEVMQLQTRLQKQLPVWLTQYLSDMDAQSIVALLRSCDFKAPQDDLDVAEIEAFVSGFKGFELSFACLQLHVMQVIAQSAFDFEVHDWLVEKAIQNKPWEQLSGNTTGVGRKQKQMKLRELIQDLQAQSVD